ncbi:MAG: hypothetical protein QOJ38_59 [Solirubrobacterales bacterium]|jgi:hypothetical protein|nr:hypothetical protein [Solirubrobacterales bacterium]
MAAAKKRLTVYLDPEIARAARVRAARTDKRDSQVIEDALRAHLGMAALDEAQALSTLSPEDAMSLASSELHAMRRERRRARG